MSVNALVFLVATFKSRLPDDTYIDLVRSLFLTLVPTTIMAVSFLTIGALVVFQTGSTVLVSLGTLAALARKDDLDHPLHAAAAGLAYDVDVQIGRTMIDIWAKRRPVADAQQLVDTYVAHPAAGGWWRNALLRAAVRAKRK